MAGSSGGVPVALGKRVVALPATIGLLAAWLLALALAAMWTQSFGLFFEWLGGKGISFRVHGFGGSVHPFGFLRTISRRILNFLFWTARFSERGFVYTLNLAVEPYLLAVGTVVALGLVTFEALKRLQHHSTSTVPQVIRETVTKPLTKAQQRAEERQAAQIKSLGTRVDSLSTRVQALSHAHAGTIAMPAPPQGITAKRLRRLARRIGKVEKATIGIGAAALVASALPKLGLKCLLGVKGRRIIGGICSVPLDVLSFLLGTALLTFVALDVCRLVTAMQTAARAFEPVMIEIVNELAKLVCGGKENAASGIVASDWTRSSRLPSGLVPSDVSS